MTVHNKVVIIAAFFPASILVSELALWSVLGAALKQEAPSQMSDEYLSWSIKVRSLRNW